MAQQTAVEWFIDKLEQEGNVQEGESPMLKLKMLTITISVSDYLDIKREAKEMQKEQTINFSKHCLDRALDLDIRTAYSEVERYYTKKYETK